MAHEISTVNGRAEAMFALNPAWHGLGTVLDNAPNSEEAINAARLDWSVELQELQTEGGATVPDHYATVRTDTGDVLGVVGSKYRIVQNRQAFEFLDSLHMDGIIRYEAAGALKGGRQVWLLARMPSVDEIAPGDNSYRYVLFSTSHDGTASIHAVPTSVRVVCANTLRIATAGNIGFRHTGDVQAKLAFARKYLSQFDERFTLFRDKARILAQRQIKPEQARDYIDELFPPVDEPGRSRTIREKKVQRVRNAYASDRQRMPSITGTWWALYNAVSESIDHGKRNRRRNGRDQAEKHMLSTMDGTGADMKERAFSLAVDMAG